CTRNRNTVMIGWFDVW
nr:immunoglobulin heavy chain junction region [Macaca mulatta]MOX58573.1 immunoglobulin heavy chain junction region [Macaca mulatta]MOX58826.1 immunoglobulin heavy chain junction region [Macaca mulatta]MOX58883.1 immunoglobulin heavy chain junction region [Macaca mulatta]MOX59233.1 immunoglobulin heavy chain junction region [Macaca mulatta]